MEYINSSVRKLATLFSSPPPATVLGKRKAARGEDVEGAIFQSHGGCTASNSPAGTSSKRRQADLLHSHSATGEDDFRHTRKPSALTTRAEVATQNAERAIRKAREPMGKATEPAAQSDEQEIQDELEESDRKRRPAHKKKWQVAVHGEGLPSLPRDLGPAPSTPTSNSSPWHGLTAKEKWSTKPNRRAREFLEEHGHDAAAMLQDLQEPAYVCRDTEIRDGLRKMTNEMEGFAKEHFSFTVNDHSLLRPALERMERETVKIIGSVASDGPAGASGWEDLFLAPDKRQALVCAIMGNVLIEQVFQHMFFGGTEAQIQQVAAIQYEHRHEDGFDRNALHAAKIRAFLTPTSTKGEAPITPSLHLPTNFTAHTAHISAALHTHLLPLLALTRTQTNLLPALHTLVTTAALLSLHMHLDPHTAYHFAPVFKDQPFSSTEMTCPSAAEQARRGTRPDEDHRPLPGDEALVQIALLPGVVAYRRGGWETTESTTTAPEHNDNHIGVRARRLTGAWVYGRWGRRRAWVDGKPAEDEAVHGGRWEGDFVEFSPGVLGVGDPALREG
ncbi:hypothetical protein ST47_g7767 [Ascochyta rabiei]|uniref:Uncharacterized protein n=1 Tax=Didymella rabiei TaxID=5454 RepID=A0A163ABR8_DIDRA|nr:hypothetical protein ST47_g7767 [Ascochyta rabiei]